MSKPVYLMWLNPEMVADVDPPTLQAIMSRCLFAQADRENVIVVCPKAVYDSLAEDLFFFGNGEVSGTTAGHDEGADDR